MLNLDAISMLVCMFTMVNMVIMVYALKIMTSLILLGFLLNIILYCEILFQRLKKL